MSSTYTPSETFKEGSEKDWPAKLGGLDWDTTRIIFTKRTLIEFLRYTGTSVDPNLNNIAKLPRYADFGKLQQDGAAAAPGVANMAPGAGMAMESSGDAFKPSRRVRTAPGGAQTFTLGDGSDDVLDTRPVRNNMESLDISDQQPADTPKEGTKLAEEAVTPVYKPSRRVKDGPGGPSSMATLWDDHTEAESFKPTRRVREGPGGVDSISQIF